MPLLKRMKGLERLVPNRVQIAPSILSADFAHLAKQIQAVERGGASLLHLDVMDGHFVPNITIGPPVVAAVREGHCVASGLSSDDLRPRPLRSAFCEAGAERISVHQEACLHLDRTLSYIRNCGAAAGAVINPATPVEMLSEVLECADYVLVMSVNPGFGGQQFIPRSLDKIGRLARMREERGLEFLIEIDGGISSDNVLEAVQAGTDIIVAGSSVFHSADPAAAVELLLKRAETAMLSEI